MRSKNDQVLRDSPNNRCDLKALIQSLDFQNRGSCFILRDDLLLPPFSGSKHRKYLGLFEYLQSLKPSVLIIPGSCASNHFVTSIYLAKRHSLPLLAITKKPQGTLLPNAKAAFEMLSSDELLFCENFFEKADEWQKTIPGSFVMPLGGFHEKAALSSLSLGFEIAAFHEDHKLDHIFLDAGTGMQAASCMLALEDRGYRGHVTVVKMGELDFESVLEKVALWTNLKHPSFSYDVIFPKIAKSYARTNRQLENFRREFFQKTNIPLDVTYNAKLFYTAFKVLDEMPKTQNALIVHSGGTYAGTISE